MNKKYYKFTNKDECHHGFQYKDGLNEDHLPFNETDSCCPGGLYFSDAENILQFIKNRSHWIREVTPDTEKMVRDPDNDPIKWRSKSLDCQPRKSLSDIDTWKWMMDQGILNNQKSIDNALQWSSHNGHLEVVKFLVEKFDNFSQQAIDYALKWSSNNGHLEVGKYLVEKFPNFSQSTKYLALKYSSKYGNLEVYEYVKQKFPEEC